MKTETKEVVSKPRQVEVASGESCPFTNSPCPHQCAPMAQNRDMTWCTMWVNFQREMGRKETK